MSTDYTPPPSQQPDSPTHVSKDNVLKDVGNQDKLLGVPVSNVHARSDKNTVSWSEVVCRSL